MSPWTKEQTEMLVEQGMVDMCLAVGSSFTDRFPVGIHDGEEYIWSGVRWFRKREQTWR